MISIKGVRVEKVEIERDEKGGVKVQGSYSIISSGDKVIATQTFNGYSSIKVELDGDGAKAVVDARDAIQRAIEKSLWID